MVAARLIARIQRVTCPALSCHGLQPAKTYTKNGCEFAENPGWERIATAEKLLLTKPRSGTWGVCASCNGAALRAPPLRVYERIGEEGEPCDESCWQALGDSCRCRCYGKCHSLGACEPEKHPAPIRSSNVIDREADPAWQDKIRQRLEDERQPDREEEALWLDRWEAQADEAAAKGGE